MLSFLSETCTHPHTPAPTPLTVSECLEKHVLAVGSISGHSAGPHLDHVAGPWPQTLQNHIWRFALHNWGVQWRLGLEEIEISGTQWSKTDCSTCSVTDNESKFSAESWPLAKRRLIFPPFWMTEILQRHRKPGKDDVTVYIALSYSLTFSSNSRTGQSSEMLSVIWCYEQKTCYLWM